MINSLLEQLAVLEGQLGALEEKHEGSNDQLVADTEIEEAFKTLRQLTEGYERYAAMVEHQQVGQLALEDAD